MPRNVCCVPGCPNRSEDEMLKGFKNGVCRQHFKEAFLYPKNRLCKLAVPSLLLPIEGISASSADQLLPDQPSTSHNVTLCLSNKERQKPIRKTVKNRPHTSETYLKKKINENKVKKLQFRLQQCLKGKQKFYKRYLLAKKVFSKSVSVALGFLEESGTLPKESADTARLLMLFDQLFDSVNANFHKEEGNIYRSAVTQNSPHLKLWNSVLPILKSMRFLNKDEKEIIVPSLTSWVKTIEGFKLIIKWIAIVRNQRKESDWTPSISSRICSNHFKATDMYTSTKGRTLLKKIALPVKPEILNHNMPSSPTRLDNVSTSDMEEIFETPPKAALKRCIRQLEYKQKLQKKNKVLAQKNRRLKKKVASIAAQLKEIKKRDYIIAKGQICQLNLKNEVLNLVVEYS
ncbi:unnamed protein product, partial [Iphiclides podalirius]